MDLKKKAPDMTGVKAVIFDMDGSLIDSMWMWKNIDIEYLGRHGITMPDNLQSEIEGKSIHETAEYFKEVFPIEDDIETMIAQWNDMAMELYKTKVFFKSGAEDFLRKCRELGISMGIATSNSKELADAVTESLHIRDYIPVIKTGTEVKKGKPAPDIYLLVAKELGVLPKDCLVFEDITAGIQAGLAAGMKVCAVKDAYSIDQDEEKRNLADYYITDYSEIMF